VAAADAETLGQHLDGQGGEFAVGNLQHVAEHFFGKMLIFHTYSYFVNNIIKAKRMPKRKCEAETMNGKYFSDKSGGIGSWPIQR